MNLFKTSKDQVLFNMPWDRGLDKMSTIVGCTVRNIKRHIKALREAGHVERTGRVSNGGEWKYELTPAGEKARQKVIAAIPQPERRPFKVTTKSVPYAPSKVSPMVNIDVPYAHVQGTFKNPSAPSLQSIGDIEIAPEQGFCETSIGQPLDLCISEGKEGISSDGYAMDISNRHVQLVGASHGIHPSIPNHGFLDEESEDYYRSQPTMWNLMFDQPYRVSEREVLEAWVNQLADLGSDVAMAIVTNGYDRDRVLGLMKALNEKNEIWLMCSNRFCERREFFHEYFIGKECFACFEEGYFIPSGNHQPFRLQGEGYEIRECWADHPLVEGRKVCEYGHTSKVSEKELEDRRQRGFVKQWK